MSWPELVLVGDGNDILTPEIENELIKKYNYSIVDMYYHNNDNLFSLPELYSSDNLIISGADENKITNNHIFLYSNFIPNVEKHIFDFLTMARYFESYKNNNKIIAVIPYMEYGFNQYFRTFIDFERSRLLSEMIINCGISEIITVNNEFFQINKFFEMSDNTEIEIENISMIEEIFDKTDIDLKHMLFLSQENLDKCEENYYIIDNTVLNPFNNDLDITKIEKIKDEEFVIFVPIVRDINLLSKLLNYLIVGKPKSIEIVCLGILPDKNIFEFLNNPIINRIITSDVIPLTTDLMKMNKLELVSSFDKIIKAIHYLND